MAYSRKKSEWRGPSRGPFGTAPDSSTSFSIVRILRSSLDYSASIRCRVKKERKEKKKRTEEIEGRMRVSFSLVPVLERKSGCRRSRENNLMRGGCLQGGRSFCILEK